MLRAGLGLVERERERFWSEFSGQEQRKLHEQMVGKLEEVHSVQQAQ